MKIKGSFKLYISLPAGHHFVPVAVETMGAMGSRKKCKACQDDNHFKSKECKRCGGALDIQSPISNLLVDQGGLLPVRAMECQLFMQPALMAMNRATPSTRLQV